MCIIAVKPAGVPMPDDGALRLMWQANPDGAGIMYPQNGQVHIEKGFMRLRALHHRLRQLQRQIDVENTTVVLHFRTGTAGEKCPANTHPFPVVADLDELRKVKTTCDIGVVHNGIINITRSHKDISDTMEYILSQLALIRDIDPHFYKNPKATELISNQVQSKLAFMTPDGMVYTLGGTFVQDGGMYYSNHSFEPWAAELFHHASGSGGFNVSGKWRYKSKENCALCEVSLVWLNPDEEYITLADGCMTDAEGCLIDEYGEVYVYNQSKKHVIEVVGARVLPMGTKPTVFDEDEAEDMSLLVEW